MSGQTRESKKLISHTPQQGSSLAPAHAKPSSSSQDLFHNFESGSRTTLAKTLPTSLRGASAPSAAPPVVLQLRRTVHGFLFADSARSQSGAAKVLKQTKQAKQGPKVEAQKPQAQKPDDLAKLKEVLQTQIVAENKRAPDLETSPTPILSIIQNEPGRTYEPPFINRLSKIPYIPCQWINDSQAHQIEKRHFPEFFKQCSTKTPQLYLNYRNFIINLYKLNPGEYLTKIACRKALVGDANIIIKIHQFLEKHKIINQKVCAYGHDYFQSSYPPKQTKIKVRQDTKVVQEESDLIFNSIKIMSKTIRPICQSCGLYCGLLWFKKTQSEEICCQTCFCDQNIISESDKKKYTKHDFVSRYIADPNLAKTQKNSWTVQETVRLLDLLASQDMTWDKVRDNIGRKRSKEDIILHFLQLPIFNFKPTEESSAKQTRHPLSLDDIIRSTSFTTSPLTREDSHYKYQKQECSIRHGANSSTISSAGSTTGLSEYKPTASRLSGCSKAQAQSRSAKNGAQKFDSLNQSLMASPPH